MIVEDIRKLMEGLAGKLTPTKAQELARSLVGEDRTEKASKFAQEMLEWQQRNLDRVRELVVREVRGQLKAVGVATQTDVDSLKKRVRTLEREHAAVHPAAPRKKTAGKSSSSRTAPRKTATKA